MMAVVQALQRGEGRESRADTTILHKDTDSHATRP